MTRLVGALWLVAWWALALLDLLWWSPAIALMAARLVGVWLRSWATLAAIDVLHLAGRHEVARAVAEAAAARCAGRLRGGRG